jgi:hypothetical protein
MDPETIGLGKLPKFKGEFASRNCKPRSSRDLNFTPSGGSRSDCLVITLDVKISTKCEIELWTPVTTNIWTPSKIFGLLKKNISNLTAKMVCKNRTSPVLPLDTRTLLTYI